MKILLAVLFTLIFNSTMAQTDSVIATYQGKIYSGYSTDSCSGGCLYSLSVIIPARTSVSDIKISFMMSSYYPCYLDEAGYSFSLGNCKTECFHCRIHQSGWFCNTWDFSEIKNLENCLPASKCVDDTLEFFLDVHRYVNSVTLGCDSNCYRDAEPFSVKIIVTKISKPTITATLDTVCSGSSILLSVVDSFGPNTVTWSPGGMTGDSIYISPTANTTYVASITDACGNLSTDSIHLVVNTCTGLEPYADRGFTIHPNPARDAIIIQSDHIKSKTAMVDVYNAVGEKQFSEMINSEDIKKGHAVYFDKNGFFLLMLITDEGAYVNRVAIVK